MEHRALLVVGVLLAVVAGCGSAPPPTPPAPDPLAYYVGDWVGRGRSMSIDEHGAGELRLRGPKCDDPGVFPDEPCEPPDAIGGADTVLGVQIAPELARLLVLTTNSPTRFPIGSGLTISEAADHTLEFDLPVLGATGGRSVRLNLCHLTRTQIRTVCG